MKEFAKWPCGRGHRGGDVKLRVADTADKIIKDKMRRDHVQKLSRQECALRRANAVPCP